MAVSSIGNLTFINQNAQVSSAHQAGTQHKGDIANIANMQDFQDKLNGTQEVRKLEENEAINPDRDSQKKRHDQEEDQKQRARSHHQEEQEGKTPQVHLLDIKA
ncbi:hypothetical protein CQA62_00945 [Helicobacter cholecystus]|uniref:Uncharacterized protein n=1 Tax=Helicobacter cholecystus TaxID=45498 RepID=A0A3D8IZM7_9HELI|nr:hypothetical protein [Helicobacter cholecystus]RDU70011.1 hypothetical protein CQA62_00945 [Helicobacter cholecystus]VEJ24820.1 Uncharacterised protein [Helicobacter cholecystus]